MAQKVAGIPSRPAGRPSGRPPGVNALVLILLFGMTGTFIFAMAEQRNAVREQEIVFQKTADSLVGSVRRAANARTAELSTAANFVREAGPVGQSVFEGFLLAEEQFTAGNATDPGVLLIEPMRRGEVDARVAAERAAGNADFEVSTFSFDPDAELLVVTRTTVDADVEGIRVRGLDITPFRAEMLGPADLPAFGETVNWIEPVSLVTSVAGVDEDQLSGRDTEIYDVTAVLIRPVEPGNPARGWVVRFVNSQDLLGQALEALPNGVNVRLTVDHIESAVAEFRTDGSLESADAGLLVEEFVEFSTAGWRVEVWASDEYLHPTGLFDQSFPWLFGSALTALAMLLDLFLRRSRRRLTTAEFELDHARTLAQTDPLTGLLNRQGLIDSSRTTEESVPAALYFVDLDGFKQVNDTDGHDAGDRLLQQVARSISEQFRADDIVARLGGDEFVVFVPGNFNPVLLRTTSERIVRAVSSVDNRVTCSLGVATRDGGGTGDVKTMLRAADTAMYEAKRAGGNRFVHA